MAPLVSTYHRHPQMRAVAFSDWGWGAHKLSLLTPHLALKLSEVPRNDYLAEAQEGTASLDSLDLWRLVLHPTITRTTQPRPHDPSSVPGHGGGRAD